MYNHILSTSAIRRNQLNVKAKLKLIHSLSKRNGKPLYFLDLNTKSQMFPSGMYTNHMEVILLRITEKYPPRHPIIFM